MPVRIVSGKVRRCGARKNIMNTRGVDKRKLVPLSANHIYVAAGYRKVASVEDRSRILIFIAGGERTKQEREEGITKRRSHA
jgi:hypothetical protein